MTFHRILRSPRSCHSRPSAPMIRRRRADEGERSRKRSATSRPPDPVFLADHIVFEIRSSSPRMRLISVAVDSHRNRLAAWIGLDEPGPRVDRYMLPLRRGCSKSSAPLRLLLPQSEQARRADEFDCNLLHHRIANHFGRRSPADFDLRHRSRRYISR